MFTRNLSRWALCALSLLAFAALASANPVISEFMADNKATIADEDGAFSDWIEVHNPTAAPIDLSNWCLTDSASQLAKWRFPAGVTLSPGEFLIVWASAKNKRVAGQPLHTNFSLAAGGEYLALVRADGTTVQHEFAPQYPSQDPDRAYGLSFNGTTLVAQGAAARYLVPANGNLGTTWTTVGFNHGTWASGTTGIGFGVEVPGMTVRQVRKASGGISNLTETDRVLALPPGSPEIGAEATVIVDKLNYLGDGADGRFGGNYPLPFYADSYCLKVTGTIRIPTAGAWTFGINGDDGSRIRINGQNVMVDDTAHAPKDTFGTITLAAGTHTFEVVFFEGGGGDEVEFFAAPGTYTTWNTNFRLVGDTANGGLQVTTLPVSAGASGSVIGTNVESAMRNVNASAYLRVPFSASNTAGFNTLSLKMRYNDGFVAYLNGTEIARRNAPAATGFNATATATRTTAETLTTEAMNVTAVLPQVVAGSNVLAIHGLNVSADDSTFLALPELVAGGLTGGNPVFFKSPTPGAVNSEVSSQGRVLDTQFSVKRGFFTAPFQLAISTPTPDAVIRYTLDGSTPKANTGTVYSGPIAISRTTVVRAAAFKTGWDPTNVDTQTYLFLNDVITQPTAAPTGWPTGSVNGQVYNYGMDPTIVNSTNSQVGGQQVIKDALMAIPTVSLVTDLPNLVSSTTGIYSNPSGRGFTWERPCSIELLNDPEGGFQADAGVRVRGGFSRSGDNPKHAFHFFFRQDYGTAKLKYPVFGREGTNEFDQLDLRTAQNYSWSFGGDSRNTFLREEFSRVAQGAMGQPYARLRYYHLYINGQYWGLFNTEERTEASYAASYFGGSKEDYDVIKNEQTAGYTVGATDGDLTAWQELWTKARAHSSSPTNANYFRLQGLAADGVTRTADRVLLDVDGLIDYNLLTFWTGNEDGATSSFLGNDRANNWFGLRQRNGTRGFSFFAHDFEHSFGLPGGGIGVDRTGPFGDPNNNRNNFSYSNPYFLHLDLMGNAEYRMRFGDRVHKHLFNGGPLSPTGAQAIINKNADTVDKVIAAESARWGDSKRTPAFTRLDWINAKNGVLSFAAQRQANILTQLRTDGLYPAVEAPSLEQFGGYISSTKEVVISGGPGTIYYTTDGTDPRLLGGGLNPNARIHTPGAVTDVLIPLASTWRYLADGSNQGTAWRAVGFNDSSWPSGPAELGYGDGDEATVVPDGRAAGGAGIYFRRTFEVPNPATVNTLTIQLRYDDGAAVYINGTEVVRTSNMIANAPYDYYTGTGVPDENAYYSFNIPPGVLVAGTNTIAAEVHQVNASSSDLSFSLSLTAQRRESVSPLYLTGPGERRLRMRAQNSGQWSALVDALFLVDTVVASAANLAITEIMYHPSNPTPAEIAAGFTDAGMFEFLELTNVGSQSADLAGLYFSAGIDFDFANSLTGRVLAPGGRILLVANRAAFEFRYGTGKPVAGEYSGSLDNGGERLTLMNAAGAMLRDFAYDDVAPWPVEADAGGYSLVLRRPGANPDPVQPASWRASLTLGGNPGGTDALTFAAWKAANNLTSDTADEERDGLSSLQEYALGGLPNADDSHRLPRAGVAAFTVAGVTRNYATLSFVRRIAAEDVNFIVEAADQLPPSQWNANGAVFVSATRNPDGTETVVWRSATAMPGPTGRQFLRLQTTLAP